MFARVTAALCGQEYYLKTKLRTFARARPKQYRHFTTLHAHLCKDPITGVERHGEQRVRLLSISGEVLLYMLPRETELEKMQLRRSPKSLQMTDGGAVTIDLSEWLMRA